MGMSGGQLVASTGVRIKALYPPQGLNVAGQADDLRYRRTVAGVADLPFGVDSGLVDTVVCQSRSLTAGATATYDLYTGTDLQQPDGAAAFRLVKYLAVFIEDGGDTSGVRIGGASSNEWVGFFAAAGDKHDIFPGGPPYQAGSPDGVAVGSSTKNLKIENRGAVEVIVTVVVGGNVLTAGMWTGILLWTYP